MCCEIDQKSTSGICHFLGSSLVCWYSRKQSSLTQSTTEAEYVAAASCCSQILWIVHTMRDYGENYKSIFLICDSSSAICLARNPVFYGRVKHIKVKHHFLRDHVENRDEIHWHREAVGWHFYQTPWCDSFCFFMGGDLLFVMPLSWFEGELVFYLVYTLSYHYSITFYSYLSNLLIALLIMLTCIWLIMLVSVLGWVEMRCGILLC
jgi:hypothetical protein